MQNKLKICCVGRVGTTNKAANEKTLNQSSWFALLTIPFCIPFQAIQKPSCTMTLLRINGIKLIVLKIWKLV